MSLTKMQAANWGQIKKGGSGAQATSLDDEQCSYLIGVIVNDLALNTKFPEIPQDLPPFFTSQDLDTLVIKDLDPLLLYEKLVQQEPDADMYLVCLAKLHKARLKYETILEEQPIPTLEQVGPRGLLQYGKITSSSLAGLLFWRKWFFDIDNRAGQETGYLFEPIIANAIGGNPFSASKSPIKRHQNSKKGRQVDCILETHKKAYELKIRVTIAASGQGRWREELDFPADCQASGYIPVLVVLDSTPNPKLQTLEAAFLQSEGEVFKGDDAWQHLDDLAGPRMSLFLEKYIRSPISNLIIAAPEVLPRFEATMTKSSIDITVGGETLRIDRASNEQEDEGTNELPNDIGEDILG